MAIRGRVFLRRALFRTAPGFALALTLAMTLCGSPKAFTGPAASRDAARPRLEDNALPAGALARIGSTRLRTTGYALDLQYSPDGTLLASFGYSEFEIWDAQTGALRRRIAIPTAGIFSPAGRFSPDGKSIVLFKPDSVSWYDVATGTEKEHLDVNFDHFRIVLSSDAKIAAGVDASASADLVVIDLPSGKERLRKTSNSYFQYPLAFSPDGKILAELQLNLPSSSIHFLDTKTGDEVGYFKLRDGVRQPVVTFSPDGERLLVRLNNGVYDDHVVQLCDVRDVPSGKLLRRIERPKDILTGAGFAPNGQVLFVGMDERQCKAVRVDPVDGKQVRQTRLLLDPSFTNVQSLRFSPDHKFLAIGHDQYITQLDLATGERCSASAQLGNLPSRFSADGKQLWIEREGYLALIDWQSGREIRRVPGEGCSAFTVLSRDGSRIAGTNSGGKLTIWDAASAKEECAFATTVELSSLPGYEKLQDVALKGERALRTLPFFSSDMKKLYFAGRNDKMRCLDLNSSKNPIGPDRDLPVTFEVGSSDGRLFAGWNSSESLEEPRQVRIWDVQGGREFSRFAVPSGAMEYKPLVFNDDGGLLAALGAGCATNLLTIHDTPTGKCKFTVSDLEYRPTVAAFSPDSRLLAVGDSSGVVHVWEISSRQERRQFQGCDMQIDRIVFSPDGKFLATSAIGDACLIWDVEDCYGKPTSTERFTAKEADKLWNCLHEADAAATFEAMGKMLPRPGPTVTLLRERLHPVSTLNERDVRRMIGDLDSDSFAVRDKAGAALEPIAESVAPFVREALANKPSPEVQRKLQHLLEISDAAESMRLRELRAVEIAERLNSNDSRDLLRLWAGGSEPAVLTRAARAALERLRGRE